MMVFYARNDRSDSSHLRARNISNFSRSKLTLSEIVHSKIVFEMNAAMNVYFDMIVFSNTLIENLNMFSPYLLRTRKCTNKC